MSRTKASFASPAWSQLQKINPLIVHSAADMVSAVVIGVRGLWQRPGAGVGPQPEVALRVFPPLAEDSASMIGLHCIYRKDESSPLLAGLLACVRDYRHHHASGLAGTPSP